MMRRHLWLPLFLAVLMQAGCITGVWDQSVPRTYKVVCMQGSAFDEVKSSHDYDLSRYWVTGNGGTLRLDPWPGSLDSRSRTEDLVLLIRTRTDGQRSNISLLRIVTPQHIITTRYQDDSISISPLGDTSRVEVLRDTDFIRIEREGERMKVTLTGRFLREYAPHGASVTWFDS